MGFAESVCNRVLFMDEGGVVEEGSPELIFKNAEYGRTRNFLRKHLDS
jgi:polar amino acid transport system ATP-binding protein